MAIRKLDLNSSIDMQRALVTVKSGTVDVDARTAEVVFTTGQAGKRWHWDIGYYMEALEVSETAIRQDRLKKGLSVISDHDAYDIRNVFGITQEYRIENGELIGTVRFGKDEESDKIFQKVVDGILRHFSLGYIVHRYTAEISPDDNTLDTYTAVDWEPTELSIVVVSFETTNGVRSAESEKPAPESLLPLQLTITGDDQTMKFRHFIPQHRRNGVNDHGGESGGGGNPAPAPAQAAQETRNAPAPAPQAAAPAPTAPVETRKVADFAASARTLGFDAENAVAAFDRGISLDEYNRELIALASKRSAENTPVILSSDQNRDQLEQKRTAIAGSIMARAGLIEHTPETRKYAGANLMAIARHMSKLDGADSFGMSPMAVANRVFQSTSDFPLILENVMNKTLAMGYEETPRTFLGLGTRKSANDFRAMHTYRTGDFPDLLPLGENGEYQSGTFSEAKESFAISTFARKIGFSRQMLINDDMSALTGIPRMVGAAGSRLESDIVWGLLLNWDFQKNKAASFKMRDGQHLYHASHNNLLTGAGSALSETSLSNARKNGREKKTLDGKFMNLNWETMVIPTGLETTAEKLLVNTILATQTANTNSFQGKYGFRVEPRLNAISETAWYMFSQMIAAFEYAYLAGEEGMYTEVVQSTDIDGMQMLARKDFGAGFADERGSLKAMGA